MRIGIRILTFCLALCLLAFAGAARAEGIHQEVADASLSLEARLGYEGQVTYGKYIPIRVTVRNQGEDLEGILGVNAYANTAKYDRFEMAVSVPAGGERTFVLPVKAGIRQDTFTVEILRSGEVLCAVNVHPEGTINPSAMLVGVLSTRPRQLANLDISQESDPLQRYEYWQTVPLTPETLPENRNLLDAFGMIVLDDTDPALLTDRQKDALKAWVRSGRILLCGGGAYAPTNLAFLGEMTALKTENFCVSASVLPTLTSWIGSNASARKPEIALAKLAGADPLVSDADGNGLIWRETAGSGRIYTLAWEAGDAALNTESLLRYFYQAMLLKTDNSLYSSALYSAGDNTAGACFAGEWYPMEISSPLPLAAILAVIAALLGCGSWVILKKAGKTGWMWVILPGLSVAAAAVIAILSGQSALNGPAAVTTVTLVQNDDGEITRYTSVNAAAPNSGVHVFSMEGETLAPVIYDDYYWYEDENETPKQPAHLRTLRTWGGEETVAVNADAPWQVVSLFAARRDDPGGRVESEIWMENDGLHGVVMNGTGLSLQEGVVLTPYGFVRIPALAPGESNDFMLESATAQDPANPVYKNGIMLSNVSYSGLYSVLQAAFGQDGEYADSNSRGEMLVSLANTASDQLSQVKEKLSGSGGTRAQFLYCAESAEDVSAPLKADGKPAETAASVVLVCAEMKYMPIGRTGVVFHAPGTDAAVRCELDAQRMPAGDMVGAASRYYHTLSEYPTFRFTLEDTGDLEISRLMISLESWYVGQTNCFLLNAYLKTWDPVSLNEAVKNPALYLDRGGNLYVQLRPAVNDAYADVPTPTLTLEGRVKHADS